MKCRVLIMLLAGHVTLQLGCGGGGVGGGGSGGSGGGGGVSVSVGGGGDIGVDVPMCSAFTACGGDLTGKWSLDGICLEGDLNTALSEATDELPSACKNMFQGVSVQLSGTVEFVDGNQISDVTSKMDLRFRYTESCFAATNGRSVKLSQSVCAQLATSMTEGEGDIDRTVSCSFSGGACDCAMSMNDHDTTTTSYTITGNTFSTEDGDTSQFCVSGKTLTVRSQDDDVAGQTKLRRL